jgi:hypothetical protein
VLITKLPYSCGIFPALRFFARAAMAQLAGAGAGGTATWRGGFAAELLQMAGLVIIGSNDGCGGTRPGPPVRVILAEADRSRLR